MKSATTLARSATDRVDGQEWPALIDEINARGCALTGPVLTARHRA